MGAKIDLLQAAVNLAVGDPQADSLVIQAIGFVIALRGVGLLHQISRLLGVIQLFSFQALGLLIERLQLFRFFVVAFVAMAAHATALAEEVFALADGPAHISAD